MGSRTLSDTNLKARILMCHMFDHRVYISVTKFILNECASISIPHPHTSWKYCWFEHPQPAGNSTLASNFLLKTMALKPPVPIRISNDLPWGGYRFSWNCMVKSCYIINTITASLWTQN